MKHQYLSLNKAALLEYFAARVVQRFFSNSHGSLWTPPLLTNKRIDYTLNLLEATGWEAAEWEMNVWEYACKVIVHELIPSIISQGLVYSCSPDSQRSVGYWKPSTAKTIATELIDLWITEYPGTECSYGLALYIEQRLTNSGNIERPHGSDITAFMGTVFVTQVLDHLYSKAQAFGLLPGFHALFKVHGSAASNGKDNVLAKAANMLLHPTCYELEVQGDGWEVSMADSCTLEPGDTRSDTERQEDRFRNGLSTRYESRLSSYRSSGVLGNGVSHIVECSVKVMLHEEFAGVADSSLARTLIRIAPGIKSAEDLESAIRFLTALVTKWVPALGITGSTAKDNRAVLLNHVIDDPSGFLLVDTEGDSPANYVARGVLETGIPRERILELVTQALDKSKEAK